MTETIHWDAFPTAFGRVYAASGPRGLCRLTWLIDDAGAFERDLADRYPDSEIVREPGSHSALERQLGDYLGGRLSEIDVGIDLSSLSEFERAVLEEARRIPYGATITYAELARKIGRPGAARAVGNALRHNPLPILVPCHRIIRADGSPGGYGGPTGTPEKIRLLRVEGSILL
jgi:methylated-DNA-[protein]-cysteine S-methyltransferase